MANPSGQYPRFTSVRQRREIIPIVAATTLTADQSGALVSFNIAAGVTVTLPAAAPNGTYFDFFVETTVTSVADKVITGAGTELLVGQALSCDTDTSNTTLVFPSLVATSNIAISLNGTTTGGIKGDAFRFTKINSTTWHVFGQINNNSVVATPFATS